MVFFIFGWSFPIKKDCKVPAVNASWTQHITHLDWHWDKETLCTPQLIKTISQQQKAISPQWKSNNSVTAQLRATKSIFCSILIFCSLNSDDNICLFYRHAFVEWGVSGICGFERKSCQDEVAGHFTTAGVCVVEVWREWWIQDYCCLLECQQKTKCQQMTG